MKLRWLILLLSLFSVLQILSCAGTTIHCVSNPEIKEPWISRILVLAPFKDIGRRRNTEEIFVKYFRLYGFEALPSINLIPPVKTYSEKDVEQIIKENYIDGVLVTALEDFWHTEVYINRTYVSTISKSEIYTEEYGGYSILKPNAKFEIRLLLTSSQEIAWIATTYTHGSVFTDYEKLINSLAPKVVKELEKEKIIIKPFWNDLK